MTIKEIQEIAKLQIENTRLRDEVDRLREALEYYANDALYINLAIAAERGRVVEPLGRIAQEALQEKG